MKGICIELTKFFPTMEKIMEDKEVVNVAGAILGGKVGEQPGQRNMSSEKGEIYEEIDP
jgi:hypothetical protein